MELFHRLIYEQFALYVPCSISRNITDNNKVTLQNGFIPGGLVADWFETMRSDWFNIKMTISFHGSVTVFRSEVT